MNKKGKLLRDSHTVYPQVIKRPTTDQLLLALKNAHIATWELDVITRKGIFSSEMEMLHGFLPGTWIDHSISNYVELVYADDQQLVSAALKEALIKGTGLKMDYRIEWSDGSIHWLRSHAEVEFDHENKPIRITGICMEVTQEKDAERKLQYFTSLNQSITDAIATMDKKFRFISWNSACESLYGWKEKEVIGEYLSDILPTEFLFTSASKFSKQLFSKGFWKGEVIQTRKDGKKVYALSSVSVMKDTSGKIVGIVSANRDITHLKKTEEELRNSEQRFRAIIEHSADGIRLIDATGNIMYVSPSTERILGYTEEEYIHQNIFDLIHPNDKQKYKDLLTEILKYPGRTVHLIYRVRHKDRSWRWIEGSVTNLLTVPHVQAIVSNFRDITESKRLEEKIKKSERELQAIIDGSPIVIYMKDRQGKYIMVNKQYELLFHIERSHIKGKTDFSIWPEEIAEKLRINDQQVLTTEQPLEVEEIIPHDDGFHTYLSIKFPLFDHSGNLYAVCGISTDISESKRIEARKDEFISMASHELKTPVTSIKGFTQILQRHAQKTGREEELRYLNRMDEQINKLTKLITDLLDVSRMQQGKLQFQQFAFAIDSLVKETIETIQPTTDDHRIFLKGKTGKKIYGDPDRISQVLINLLTNAIKYSPDAKDIVVSLSLDAKEVIVSVKDYGIGISGEHQRKIFERFYRVYDIKDKTFPGLGIGLYLSNEIIKRHGGRMWVKSKKNKGATFYFSLPLKKKYEKR